MAATLPAKHLARRFLLFLVTVVLLLSMSRAALALLNIEALDADGALPKLFLHGLRFDLATVGVICLVPIVVGPLLGMCEVTRGVARFLIVAFLMLGLAFVLMTEYLTPWFLDRAGARPGLADYPALADPRAGVMTVFSSHPVAMVLGAALAVLVLVAFRARLEVSRLLRFPLATRPALAFALVGGGLCLLAIRFGADAIPDALADVNGTDDGAQIEVDGGAGNGDAAEVTLDELAMNTALKALGTIPGVRRP